MTGHRPFYLAFLTWLAVVAVGSTLVWAVVGHAGRNVAQSDTDTMASAPELSGAPTPTGSPNPSTSPSSTKKPTRKPSPTQTTSAPPSTPSSSTGGSTGGHASPSATASPKPPSSASSSTAPSGQAQRRTWQGTAGTVVASCSGSRISLVAAQPNSGWRVEVEDRGPEEVSVHFKKSEDSDRSAARRSSSSEEVEVHARCVKGAPAFNVED
ncbi:hypothetical protein [Nocardioides sp.]|uniref:hypothetical protein n=1 Tax=Nocardioides sp. TaxID=35761 RepID=UPI0035614CF6